MWWRRQWKNTLVLFVTGLTLFCVFLLTDVPKYEPQLYIPADFKAHKTMTSDQWILFLKFKEQQYKERRIQLKHFCHKIKKTDPLRPLMLHPNPNAMIYDKKHKLAYCQIPKVGSSTWCMHFLTLANASEQVKEDYSQALQIAAVHLWPLPKFVGKFSALMKDMTSFMFVRNPWTRLVSVYFEKILGNPLGAWDEVNQEIISSQRNGKRSKGKTPKRSEFLQYVLEDLESWSSDMVEANIHWRPQSLACPICTGSFKIIGKLEEMWQDTLYLMHRNNLWNLMDGSLHENTSGRSNSNRDYLFWKGIDCALIKDLYGAYEYDFIAFGYNPIEYFVSIGLQDTATLLQQML